MVKRLRVLGIDPGSRYCGYGVVEVGARGAVRYIECGVIEPEKDASVEARLAEIFGGLRDVIAELSPVEVAVEGVFHGVNARSALKLGQARGIALAAAGERGLSVHEYAPATVKLTVTGSGRAQKTQVQEMVRAICGLRRAPRVDASDALAIAICHVYRSGASR